MPTPINLEEVAVALAASGWAGGDDLQERARIRLSMRPASMEDFTAKLKDANDIRALVKMAAPSLEGMGYRTENLAEDFVAGGFTSAQFRADVVAMMAAADVHTSNVRKISGAAAVSSVYAERAAQIDELVRR